MKQKVFSTLHFSIILSSCGKLQLLFNPNLKLNTCQLVIFFILENNTWKKKIVKISYFYLKFFFGGGGCYNSHPKQLFWHPLTKNFKTDDNPNDILMRGCNNTWRQKLESTTLVLVTLSPCLEWNDKNKK